MVSAIDETVSNVTMALRSEGLWGNTLFVFASDNGSPVSGWGAGGTNAPLRGGKDSDWEGGVRTPAFLNGGVLPPLRRGMRLSGLAHISDLYATFCALAGARTLEGAGGKPGCTIDNGPAPVDAVDLGPWLLRGDPEAASPRQEIIHDINGHRRCRACQSCHGSVQCPRPSRGLSPDS